MPSHRRVLGGPDGAAGPPRRPRRQRQFGEDLMTAADRARLRRILDGRRATIVEYWARAIARTSFVPLGAAAVRERLAELADRAIQVMLSESPEGAEAEAIGASLARLRYIHPTALRGTLEALALLATDLPAEDALLLQPCLAALLARVAAGFYAEARQVVLADQEAIRAALLTAQEEAEAALWASEERFRAIFESAAIGIGLADTDGRIFETNRALQAMLGYDADDFRRMNVTDFTHPEDQSTDWDLYRELAGGRRDGFAVEKRFYRKDRRLVWCLLTVSLVRDAEGRPQFTIALMEDITARKEAQETVQRLNAELERRVAERTAQLAAANVDLAAEVARRARAEGDRLRLLAEEQAARREAEEALAARDEFLSIAAHELKTPISILRMAAQAFLRYSTRGLAVDSRQVRGAIQTVDEQSAKLARMVVRLLEISRLQMGRFSLECRPENLTALVSAAVELARLRASEHPLALSAPAEAWASVDSMRFEQVVTNLLDNAIKYSPDGGPIEVALEQPAPEVIVLSVRDRGLGIPPEHRAHIFDLFYRAHSESHQSGMGVGLYVTRQIVELHGGRITVECPPDGGSCFRVELPALLSPGLAAPDGPAPGPGEGRADG